ncbi:MAG TPA: restriction endonuclease [Burkholderiaceae bacterium]|nr:restriction endonuclease [Burkholderiaceae bacterium]
MWKFAGTIQYICNTCGDHGNIRVDDFDTVCIGGYERSMGTESIYGITYEYECPKCNQTISLAFEVSEYPVECLNFVSNNSSGAQTVGEPGFEYLREIYSAEDMLQFYVSIPELVSALKSSPDLLRDLSPWEFEEVVAEVFRAKGFVVDLTKRTRDGGKDIIAVHTDGLGIQSKYFIECKHYAESNKVGVGVVRALHGVMNTKDGPNKTILATTSTFTSGAKGFVENEASSKWDMSLADYDEIVRWLSDYQES